MTWALSIVALVLAGQGDTDRAMVAAVVAVAYAVLRLRPSRARTLWDRSIAEHEATLFSGERRDD